MNWFLGNLSQINFSMKIAVLLIILSILFIGVALNLIVEGDYSNTINVVSNLFQSWSNQPVFYFILSGVCAVLGIILGSIDEEKNLVK